MRHSQLSLKEVAHFSYLQCWKLVVPEVFVLNLTVFIFFANPTIILSCWHIVRVALHQPLCKELLNLYNRFDILFLHILIPPITLQ